MVIPIIIGAIGAAVGGGVAVAAKTKEADERLDLVKKLADLTPEQVRAVDAAKTQSVDELRTRVELGIGPFAPLPPNASARAQENRQRRMAELAGKPVGTKLVSLTDAERASVENAPDREAAVKALVEKKVREARP